MNMIAFEIPELHQERTSWLEDRLVSQDFSDFVAQLEVSVLLENSDDRKGRSRLSLVEILGTDRVEILNDGLSGISSEQFFNLLYSPSSLAELNEEVFIYGGEYWGRKIDFALRHARRMALNPVDSTSEEVASPKVPTGVVAFNDPGSARSKDRFKPKRAYQLFFVAASVAVFVCCNMLFRAVVVDDSDNQLVSLAWGWERNDWFDEASTPEQYMTRMIEGAKAWGKVPINSKEEYVKRLRQLMKGCQKVIDSNHPLLTKARNDQLIHKCLVWKEEFIDQFAEVTESPSEFREIKKKTDVTIENAALSLRKFLKGLGNFEAATNDFI